jgi:hypothetical protein
MLEIIKNASAVVGFILSAITLCTICIKPIRKFLICKVKQWCNSEEQSKAIQAQNEAIKAQNDAIKREDSAIQEMQKTLNKVVESIAELSDRIFKNEADRLRSELFDCGNRCRRGIPLSGEEFRHIQDVFRKYSQELKCNGIGEDEYNFIKDYFNSKSNQDKLNKKYDN